MLAINYLRNYSSISDYKLTLYKAYTRRKPYLSYIRRIKTSRFTIIRKFIIN